MDQETLEAADLVELLGSRAGTDSSARIVGTAA
jgi:hypothetical protein